MEEDAEEDTEEDSEEDAEDGGEEDAEGDAEEDLEEDAEEDTEETILFIALLIQSYFCFRCDASIVPGCQRTSEEGENRETVIFHFL